MHEGATKLLREVADDGTKSVPLSAPRPLNKEQKRRLTEARHAVANYSHEECRRLAIQRTLAQPEVIYRLLDGRRFTATSMAQEIEQGTDVGLYFASLQKKSVLVAIDAFNADSSDKTQQ